MLEQLVRQHDLPGSTELIVPQNGKYCNLRYVSVSKTLEMFSLLSHVPLKRQSA